MATYQTDKVKAGGGKSLEAIPARALVGTTTIVATEVVDTALVADDIIELFSIPANATIVDGWVQLDGNLGTTSTFDVGDSDNVDRFIDGGDGTDTTGALVRFGNVAGSAATGPGYTYSSATNMILTIVTAAAGTTDVTLKASVTYVVNN